MSERPRQVLRREAKRLMASVDAELRRDPRADVTELLDRFGEVQRLLTVLPEQRRTQLMTRLVVALM
ncbi:MAG: hypothetical protein AAFX81_17795, partial [Pseudomonadota bacterium]